MLVGLLLQRLVEKVEQSELENSYMSLEMKDQSKLATVKELYEIVQWVYVRLEGNFV